ncbi:hypothetical protein [Kocuria dechangensis]|uniref:hypothetical protein n=1 Tax=Kocuria dechangensis TaxID=1176249 RepID=UPI00166EEE1D|nr:hypothetical protein [Kocuria dechangensis]
MVLQIITDGGGYGADATAQLTERRRKELVAFINAQGRLPSHRSGDVQEQELRRWVQRHLKRPHPDPVVVELVERLGRFTREPTVRTGTRLAELEQFVADHGRLPNTGAEDEQEASLAIWLAAHRNRHGAHERVLEIVGRYKTDTPTMGTDADRRLEQLRAFVTSLGRRPKLTRTRPEESSLARWAAAALAHPELAEPVREILEPYGLITDQPRQRGLSPDAARRIEQLRTFVTTHGRAPRHYGNQEELSLYRWLHRADRARDPEPEVLQILAELGHPSAHARRVSQLEQFVAAHGRLPRSVGVEHELYTWMNQHIQRARADPKVLALVAAHADEESR